MEHGPWAPTRAGQAPRACSPGSPARRRYRRARFGGMGAFVMRVCGLDFGTSNTAAALPEGRVLPIAPGTREPRLFRSVLFFPEDERTTYAGEEAITRYLDDNAGRFIQSVKSFLHSRSFRATQVHSRTWTIEDLVAVLLRRVREAAGAQLGGVAEAVMLGRPALFSPEPEADALAEQRLRKA